MMAPPARVLLVEAGEDGTTGGSHRCLFDLVRRLDRSRFEPVVILYQGNRFVEPLRDLGVDVTIWGAEREEERGHPRFAQHPLRRLRLQARAVARRRRLLREGRIDLVHLNNTPLVGCSDWLPAAWLARVPCISHVRAPVSPRAGRANRFLIRRYQRVVAVSRYIAASTESAGIPSPRIIQIYDGIDIDAFRRLVGAPPGWLRRQLGLPSTRRLVIMVGHVRPWKGHQVVLQALTAMDPALLNRLHVVFVGGTPPDSVPYHATLLQEVQAGGLGDAVTFLGERSDIPDIMEEADAVLHASTDPEPFGLVVVEAMALGKLVLAAASGGPAEVIVPGTGLTFDPGNPDQLARLLAQVAASSDLGDLPSPIAARQRAACFSIERNVSAIEALYDELLGGRRVGRPANGSGD